MIQKAELRSESAMIVPPNQASPARASVQAVPVNRTARLMLLLFMLGMVVPIWIQIGSILLMPHRLVLLLLFVPALIAVFSGQVGRIRSFDILMLLSTIWAVMALLASGSLPGTSLAQQIGIYTLETFGAYLLARVTIRSAEDFAYFTKLFFIALVILVPFGVIEAVTHRAVMLELIPKSVRIVSPPERWGLRRAQTVFSHPILFGVFCSIGFGLLWYAMRSKLTRVGGTILSFIGTFVSLSSGALVAIVIQTILMLWEMATRRIGRRWTIFSILAAAGYLTVDLLSNRTPFHVLITYATFNTGSAYNRILIWRYGMENVWDHPMFGLGAYVSDWVRAPWMSSSTDNYWLLMAMQYGIPCFLFMAAAIFLIIRKVGLAQLTNPRAIACRAGYLTAVGGLIIAGGTVHYWHGVMAFVMFFFGAGVWVVDVGAQDAASSKEATPKLDDVPDALLAEPDPEELIYTRQPARHRRARLPRTRVRAQRDIRARKS